MSGKKKFETRRRPDFSSVARAAHQLARSRYLASAGLVDVQDAEVSSHVFEAVTHQPGRRTLPKETITSILQRAEDAYARFAESQDLPIINAVEYDS